MKSETCDFDAFTIVFVFTNDTIVHAFIFVIDGEFIGGKWRTQNGKHRTNGLNVTILKK